MGTPGMDEFHTFHLTGHGLEERRLQVRPDPLPAPAGLPIPLEPDAYPILVRPDFSIQAPLSGEADGWLIPFETNAAVSLAAAAVLRIRGQARTNVLIEMQSCLQRLNDVAGSAEPVRQARCRTTAATLREYVDASAQEPPYTMFHVATTAANPFAGETQRVDDPFAAALAYAVRQFAKAAPALQALRSARLDLALAYEERVHGPMLHQFSVETAATDELAALPPVIAAMTAEEAAKLPLGSFAALLGSRYPVQIWITQPMLTAESIRGEVPDLAAAAVALRDPFVLQGSVAHLGHLLPALDAMAMAARPALAVIATPSWGGWAEATMLPLSRAWAMYIYDPARGRSLSEQLRVYPVAPNPWTPAHVAALNPVLRNSLRVIPEKPTGGVEPMELHTWLDRFEDGLPAAVPYITLTGAEGESLRVVLQRGLALYCHTRQEAWSRLEALAGRGGGTRGAQARGGT